MVKKERNRKARAEKNQWINKSEWLEKKANEINENLPASEQWFQEKLKNANLYHYCTFNHPFHDQFIIDVIFVYKGYIIAIEVDGSVHDLPEVQKRDAIKNLFFKNKCIDLIRVKSFNNKSAQIAINKIHKFMNLGESILKKKHAKKQNEYRKYNPFKESKQTRNHIYLKNGKLSSKGRKKNEKVLLRRCEGCKKTATKNIFHFEGKQYYLCDECIKDLQKRMGI